MSGWNPPKEECMMNCNYDPKAQINTTGKKPRVNTPLMNAASIGMQQEWLDGVGGPYDDAKCLAEIRRVLSEGADVKQAGAHGTGPMHSALLASYPSHRAVDMLAQAGCDVDELDDFGVTPLFSALGFLTSSSSFLIENLQEAIWRLLAHGADWLKENKDGKTPAGFVIKYATDRPGRTEIPAELYLAAKGAMERKAMEAGLNESEVGVGNKQGRVSKI